MKSISDEVYVGRNVELEMAIQSIVTDLLADVSFNVDDNRFVDEDFEKGNYFCICLTIY